MKEHGSTYRTLHPTLMTNTFQLFAVVAASNTGSSVLFGLTLFCLHSWFKVGSDLVMQFDDFIEVSFIPSKLFLKISSLAESRSQSFGKTFLIIQSIFNRSIFEITYRDYSVKNPIKKIHFNLF